MANSVFTTYTALRSGPLNRSMFAGKWGVAWQKTFGAAWDAEITRQIWARRARFPEWAPSDALIYLGAESGLEQVLQMGGGGALEDEGLYRRRLRNRWYIWQRGGSQQIHVDAFGWTGLTNVSVFRRHDAAPADGDGVVSGYVKAFQRAVWSQFDVLIAQPHPWKGVYWGDGHVWGGLDWTWGTTATVQEVEQLRRLVRRFKAGHDTCFWIILRLFGGATTWGSFTWGDGSVWGSGQYVRWLVGEPHWSSRGLV